MAAKRPSSRTKILEAAADLAQDSGAGNLSLDAVAGRAGVSKGGLLYHFPSKAALMQALVERYLADFEAALDDAAGSDDLVSAYVRLSIEECSNARASGSWILAAMAEDPDFLKPIRDFKRRLLDRLKAETADTTGLLATFVALEGLRSLALFDLDILSDRERDAVRSALLERAV